MGLSGSSAIGCAALSCLLDFYSVRRLVKVEVRINLILNAEKELGVVAGLQERVAQIYGFSKNYMEDLGHGIYTPMDVVLFPPLHIIYAENPSDSGEVYCTVRQRGLDGDKFIISSMEEVAKIASQGQKALLDEDHAKFASLMNRNLELRRQMFGEDAIGALNLWLKLLDRSVQHQNSQALVVQSLCSVPKGLHKFNFWRLHDKKWFCH
ncbi:glucuronokinase 1-like [Olea europaea subsp. europaea]|uniref:Glucuronokinase 1-like n=1 Tax=Olea europaea subsp. europaea TaxID=158383 RepID=A0A8S0URR0_OLEEU|nr:glucuronokinase 1-like [Olea europaea subsp. europaea]